MVSWVSLAVFRPHCHSISHMSYIQGDLFNQCDVCVEEHRDEIWKTVNDYPDYEVSNMGRFRNKRNGSILNGSKNHNGYIHIGFTKDGVQYFYPQDT